MIKYISYIFVLFLLLQACESDKQQRASTSNRHVEFATLFAVDTAYGYPKINVFDAWDKNQNAAELLLVPEGKSVPRNLSPEVTVLRTPVRRLAVMSGTHIAFLGLLNDLDKVVGVSDFRLVKNQRIKQRISNGDIKEIGINNTFKKEQLLAADVDAVLVSPYENQSYKNLRNMGVTVIPVPDYLETHPLGRAEWLRFFSFLSGKNEQAQQIFSEISSEYLNLKNKAKNIQAKPSIFSGKPYGGIWYQPGGSSYMSKIFEDAGADYLWKENKQSGGVPLDFETVYSKAANADFWRLVVKSEQRYSLKDLYQEDARYKDFKAFKEQQVLVCNVSEVSYYEVAPTEPNVVLADLIYWLHPELGIDHQPVYYQKISNE